MCKRSWFSFCGLVMNFLNNDFRIFVLYTIMFNICMKLVM